MVTFKVGDKIRIYDKTVVVVDLIGFENISLTSRDRDYLMCDFNYLQEVNGIVTVEELELHGWWIHVSSETVLDYTLLDNNVFSIEKEDCLRITPVSKTGYSDITIIEHSYETDSDEVIATATVPYVTFEMLSSFMAMALNRPCKRNVECILSVQDNKICLSNTTSDVDAEWEVLQRSQLQQWYDAGYTVAGITEGNYTNLFGTQCSTASGTTDTFDAYAYLHDRIGEKVSLLPTASVNDCKTVEDCDKLLELVR